MRVGNPEDPETEMGPLISAVQRESVASFVDDNVAFAGDAPDGKGFWFPPTILAPVGNSERCAQEEIFGPVASVIPFSDETEAIRIANDSPYGLSGSIWSKDAGRALRVARAVDSGVLSINSNTSVRVQTPFGGFKQSGFGRELGMAGLEGYSEIKNVFISTGG
jgi:betaine-aldehyde dehydrogenase